ncbi:MAG: Crp/Fnr family transcriptional regulator [Flavipsychrobacter sp.]|nr:Crp/Fnr family transcriptional regulator [Flavipsychrobacter sp.]
MEQVLFDFIERYMELSPDEKQLIRELSIIQSYKKGAILLKEGKVSYDSYFVLEGCLRTFSLKNNEEKTTEFYTEMEVLPPASSLDGSPSLYSISCVEDTVVCVSNPELEQAAFARFPRFEMMCRVLSEQLVAKARLELDKFKTSSAEERYLALIESRPDLFQRVPQHQLASYLGITPESLSRLRGRLVKRQQSYQ